MSRKPRLKDIEWHLLFIALVLSLIGVTFIWSVSQGAPRALAGRPFRQLVFLAVSLAVLPGVLRVGYTFFSRHAYLIYFGLILSLVGLFFLGGGAGRWYALGFGLKLQPSEFTKLGILFVLARYFQYPRQVDLTTWRGTLAPFVLVLLPMALIARQPDLGTALVLAPVAAGMLFAAGFPGRRLLLLVALGFLSLVMAYQFSLLHDYQAGRITSFLASIPRLEREALALRREGKVEEAEVKETEVKRLRRGASFQQFRSMIAIGSGGLTGKGLAQGPQNRLNALPERHTDFIFAVIGEEWGLFGCGAVLLLFFLLVAFILGVARRTRDPFGRHLCTGVALLFLTQVFINTGISVGMLPITGLTLPFVSYGGSSLLTSYLALGLVLDVGRRRVRDF